MGRAILVVDDSDHIRRILSHIIESAGAETVESEDGADALTRLEAGLMPAAVILDIMTPRLDGYGLMERMQNHPDWKKIPIVVCSARNTPEDIKKAMDLGAVEYVVKPNVTKETVIPAIKRALAAAKKRPS